MIKIHLCSSVLPSLVYSHYPINDGLDARVGKEVGVPLDVHCVLLCHVLLVERGVGFGSG